jgi:hypothetical protein
MLCASSVSARSGRAVPALDRGRQGLAGQTGRQLKALVREVQRILAGAKAPVPSEDMLAKLRRKMTLSPSDQADFFYSAMWDSRETLVYIEGAGWWLRARPYLGRSFPLDGPAPTQMDVVDETVLGMLRAADRPLTQQDILVRLKAQSIRTPIANGEAYLRRFFVQHADKIVKLTGLGQQRNRSLAFVTR